MGIALTKDIRKYGEALKYFIKTPTINKRTKPGYVSGLYWVAESYHQTGDRLSSLYLLEDGIDFQGSNTYLLNSKTKFCPENWPVFSELKPQAKEFFLKALTE